MTAPDSVAEREALLAEARERMRRADRNPWNRLRHWVHARAYPDMHRERCLKCRPERQTPDVR